MLRPGRGGHRRPPEGHAQARRDIQRRHHLAARRTEGRGPREQAGGREAPAQPAGTSKVDIWRAVQEGTLPAQRTSDGGFAIDPAELFRVFEPRRPNGCPTGQDATASPEALGRSEPSTTPETAATNDIADAFAALQVELRRHLGQVAEVRANDELHEDKDANRPPEQLDVIAAKVAHLREEAATGMERAKAVIAERETPIPAPNKKVTETPPKRPWWRRLAG
jgi:hypothetical protein